MKRVLHHIAGVFLIASCHPKHIRLHETGLLVMDHVRNHHSFDYFIPCSFNDSLTFGQNVQLITEHKARHINPSAFEGVLLNSSWPSTPDSFYVRGSWEQRYYLSAVELILERDDPFPVEDTIQNIKPIQMAKTILINQFHPGHYRIVRAKKIMLVE
jgi:hypothetical protein